MSQAQLVEARTKAETEVIAAQAKANIQREQTVTLAQAQRLAAETESEVQRIRTEADVEALQARAAAAESYTRHPALLRLRELETLQELAKQANARIYIGFDKHMPVGTEENSP